MLMRKSIRGKQVLTILMAMLLGVAANSAFAEGNTVPAKMNNSADYEVHEWGVMVGCDDTRDYLLTSRPLKITVVKEPVLYFHSRDKQPFSLKVTFNQGTPTETYPTVEKSGNTIQWDRVNFYAKAEPSVTKGLTTDGLVPFDEIINTLNWADADEIEYNGIKAKFLFYEGEMPFINPVQSTYDAASQTVSVVNTGSYPVLDLYVIVPEGTGVLPFQPKVLTAYLPKLQPGETIRVKPELAGEIIDYNKSLSELGFTEKEIRSFDVLWQNSFIKYGKLVYRLPQSECDRMIRLDFNPQPRKISRALFVLVKY